MAQPSFVDKCVYLASLVCGYTLAYVYGLYFAYRFLIKWISNRLCAVKNRELPPDCLNDPALGNHAYIQIKNIKLHYVEKGDRSKPLMLCLHGFPEFWYSWRHQLKEFSSDYWVVAIDMRGYGDSEKPVGQKHYKMDNLVADIKNLIAALGREKCILVAHDWGGVVAWYLVLREPQLIDSYVIINSAHPIAFRNVLAKSFDQFKKSWYIYFFQVPFLPEWLFQEDDMRYFETLFKKESSSSQFTETDIDAFKFIFGKPGALTFPINYYRANFMLGDRYKLKQLGKQDDFPAGLILFGENDVCLSKEIQEETVKIIANSTLVYIKDTNHFAQQDNPAAVNTEIRLFLNKLK